MAYVTVRYWAAAKAAAGVAEEQLEALTLADALDAAIARHPDGRLARVLRSCSYLVNADPVGTRAPETVLLSDGAQIEVLPPFAGG